MLAILGVVFLLASSCYSSTDSSADIDFNFDFDSDINFNELIDKTSTYDGSFESLIDPSIAEDANLNVPQLIAKYKYNAEVHFVTTEDGYILQLHRIAGSPKSPPKKGKKPAFLIHGSGGTSSCFVIAGPHNGALGFRLADEGYDVWLANTRGCLYSTNHTTYNPFGSRKDQKNYWNFALHELGIYDIPTSMDYILNKTEQTKMHVFGHSQGSTGLFILASEKPEYNEKIEMMHHLGPAVFLSHLKSPVLWPFAPYVDKIYKVVKLIGLRYSYPPAIQQKLCRDVAAGQILCENVLSLLMGYRSDQMNATLLPIIFGHMPAGTGVLQLVHLGQLAKSGRFRQFDYGRLENLIRYKRLTPPNYDLKRVTAPVAIYHSQGDWLVTMKDVQKLVKALPNVIKKYLIPHKKFNHTDFIWGKDVSRLLYDEIIATMKAIAESS